MRRSRLIPSESTSPALPAGTGTGRQRGVKNLSKLKRNFHTIVMLLSHTLRTRTILKSSAYFDVAKCSPVKVDRHLEDTMNIQD
jgi:hypothetical protein